MSRINATAIAIGLTLTVFHSPFAQAAEKVKVATTFLGLWDTSQPSFCKDRGEFEKAGLDVEVTSTRGGSENVQAVVAGGMDIGFSPGTNAVLAAHQQGAKIKIISSEFTGQGDTFFYVPSDSPLKSVDDVKGKSVAYPRPGGAGEAILLALNTEKKLDIKTVATGAMDATFTMTMTKQVDVGYSVPPSGLDAVDKGQIRIIFTGNAAESLRNQTGRVIIANSDFLEKRRAVATKFLEVLDQCIDWSYTHQDEAGKQLIALNSSLTPAVAAKTIGLYDRKTLSFGPILGLNDIVQQAVTAKFLEKPLSADDLKKLVDVIYTPQK
jgi:NitT/TauT family transport system substrate-binding protein